MSNLMGMNDNSDVRGVESIDMYFEGGTFMYLHKKMVVNLLPKQHLC